MFTLRAIEQLLVHWCTQNYSIEGVMSSNAIKERVRVICIDNGATGYGSRWNITIKMEHHTIRCIN